MTVPLARSSAWALLQAASLPDTIVTRQISEPRSWFDTVSGVASIVIAAALIALAVGLLPAAWNFRKSYKKVNELLDRVYGDINPIMRHASSVADNLNYVSTAVRQDVARLQATVAAANARLEEATRLTERRVQEFNALLEVVQGEAEDTFVSTAATLRGLREGAATFRDDALSGARDDDPLDDDGLDDPLDDPLDDAFDDDGLDAADAAIPPIDAAAPAAALTSRHEADDDRTRQAALEDDDAPDERPRIRRPRGGGAGGGARGPA